MRRFTALLLLVACMLPHLLFVNGLQALQPMITSNPMITTTTSSSSSPIQRDAKIRGLLVPRELYCGEAGYICQSVFCCDNGWNCCTDGSCCEPAYACVVAPNGVVGCCPNRVDCRDGSFDTISPQPPGLAYTLPSSITITTPYGAPTQSAEDQIIDVSVLDPHMTWSENWVLQTSSCDPSNYSMITSTKNSSFTYFLQNIDTSFRYYSYYFSIANFQAEFEVFVDGVSQQSYFFNNGNFINCTYLNSSFSAPLSTYTPTTQLKFNQNITVVVRGLDASVDFFNTDFWSLEVSRLLIQLQNSSATPTAASSAAVRAQPYRPLLVFFGVLLAVIYRA